MSKTKKKLLPKDFDALLEAGNLDALKTVFDTCDINARGGYGKQTALAYDKCPDALATWLVEQGADLSAADTWGNTPLHSRARSRRTSMRVLIDLGADVDSASSSIGTPLHAAADSHNAENAQLLLEACAQVDAINRDGLTPLELALRGCSNINLENMALLGNVLLEAGARKTPRMKEFVTEIGKHFEFHRSGFAPEHVDAASRALDQLYVMFDTPPVPRRAMHDGTSAIVVASKAWQDQHQELWELLVPSSGPAATVQGEVIRISGKISDELMRNGGMNWDADFDRMADAFLHYLLGGKPLSSHKLLATEKAVAEVKRKSDDVAPLAQVAVEWVLLNPKPVKLEPPDYHR